MLMQPKKVAFKMSGYRHFREDLPVRHRQVKLETDSVWFWILRHEQVKPVSNNKREMW
jgi:hypothetical protein